ncbi:YceI family protein [Methylomonas methanica]|nr:YceI family protein [Methylomonas methanica]
MASIGTGLAELEAHLRGEISFDAKQFPTMLLGG